MLPVSPAVSWTPGPVGAQELLAGFASQAQADAMHSASVAATHDHLLLSPSSRSSQVQSELSFSSVPPPSATQELWEVSPSHSYAADPTVAQSSPFQPSLAEDSPDRGEQSAPYLPTTRQSRREKRAAFVAAQADGQLGGGENESEPRAEGRKERPKEYCFVLTRATSQDEGASGALPPLPPNLARQLSFDGAPQAAAAHTAAVTAPPSAPASHALEADAMDADDEEDYLSESEYVDVPPGGVEGVAPPDAVPTAVATEARPDRQSEGGVEHLNAIGVNGHPSIPDPQAGAGGGAQPPHAPPPPNAAAANADAGGAPPPAAAAAEGGHAPNGAPEAGADPPAPPAAHPPPNQGAAAADQGDDAPPAGPQAVPPAAAAPHLAQAGGGAGGNA